MRARRAWPALLRPLRYRDFRLLWLGASISLTGDGVFLVALAWQALTLVSGPGGLALLGVCATGPQLLCVVAGGVLSDRMDRRRLLLATDVARALAVGAVAAIGLTGSLELWHLAVLSVVYGAGAGLAAPAFDAVVPTLVGADDLQQANALEQVLRPLVLRMAGPALGGVAVAAAGPAVAFALDALTFAGSAVCLYAMRPPPRPVAGGSGGVLAEAREGLRFVGSRTWLWATLGAASVAYLLMVGPTEVLLPYLVRNELHASAQTLGVVLAAGGVGGIAGAVLVAQLGLPRRQFTFMYVAWTLASLAVAGFGWAVAGWQLAAVSAVSNACEAAGTVAWATTKQRLVPWSLLGRVSSLDWFVSIALLPLSYALTAPAAAYLGTRSTFVLAGVLGAAVTLGAYLLPGMRHPDGKVSARAQ